jgi:hypothetical protein
MAAYSGTRTRNRNHFRVNVIDGRGTVSFLAPPHGLKVLAAAITQGATDGSELLTHASAFDAQWVADIRSQLMRFDEHNVDVVSDPFQTAIAEADDATHPAFRVMDQETRSRSLEPGRLGLVVFNFKERRIIQIQNSYANLERKDRGRIRVNGEPSELLFQYELPKDWTLVP